MFKLRTKQVKNLVVPLQKNLVSKYTTVTVDMERNTDLQKCAFFYVKDTCPSKNMTINRLDFSSGGSVVGKTTVIMVLISKLVSQYK